MEDSREQMELANKDMLDEFINTFDAMPEEQRIGVIALVAHISKWRMKAGYKSFCRSLVQLLKDGRLKLNSK